MKLFSIRGIRGTQKKIFAVVCVLVCLLSVIRVADSLEVYAASSAETYFSRGSDYFEKGMYDEAIAEYTKAIDVNLKYADAYYYRGNAYLAKGQLDRAVSDYTKVIGIRPADYRAYNSRGSAYLHQGHDDQALADFNKVLEINAKYPNAYLGRAIAYYNKGEYEKARDDVRKAQELGFQVEPEVVKKLISGKQESRQAAQRNIIPEASKDTKPSTVRTAKTAKAPPDMGHLQDAWDLGTRWTIAALYYAIGRTEKMRFPLAGARKLARQVGAEIPEFPAIQDTKTGVATMVRYIRASRGQISSKINSAYGTQAAACFDLATTANVLRSVYEGEDTELKRELVESIKRMGAASKLPDNLWEPVVSKAELNAPIQDFDEVTLQMHAGVREHFGIENQ